MSNTQFAFIDRARIPNYAALQASVEALGFDLKLNEHLNLLENTGFIPCELCGHGNVGFEIYTEPVTVVAEDDDFLLELANGLDACISMVWGGSLKDCAAVMIVSCALAKDFGAIISYEGDEPESLQQLMDGARQALDMAMKPDQQ